MHTLTERQQHRSPAQHVAHSQTRHQGKLCHMDVLSCSLGSQDRVSSKHCNQQPLITAYGFKFSTERRMSVLNLKFRPYSCVIPLFSVYIETSCTSSRGLVRTVQKTQGAADVSLWFCEGLVSHTLRLALLSLDTIVSVPVTHSWLTTGCTCSTVCIPEIHRTSQKRHFH